MHHSQKSFFEKSLQENNKKKNKQEKLILELVKQLHRVGDQQDLQIIFEQGSPESIDRELNYLIHIKKTYQKEIDIFIKALKKGIQMLS